ncbi:GH25 family lysozyme [Clostridium ihumii]|uniref:GH25 family lysozyme n=1 Tax=Clostridium ihumii TaxID=1470356 RepID=UPI00068825E5|nr:GH25 family lysozyme [Clostridium ihumii]
MQSRNKNNLKGIDVSNWQRDIDFAAVKRDGVNIVYMKASEGSNYKDAFLEQNYSRAKEQGLNVGFYHFFLGDAINEAKFFIECIKNKVSDCLLAIDIEKNNNMDKNTLTSECITFLEEIKRLTGKNVVVYTYTSFARENLDSRLSKYPVWIADYDVNPPSYNGIWSNWVGFQYTDKGHVLGVNGNCDVNEFNSGIFNGVFTLDKNEGLVLADVLNVRDKPDGAIIGTLTNGAVIRIDKKVDNWYSIYFGDHGGYISSDYVKTEFEKENIKKEVYDMKTIVLYFGDMDANAAIYVAQKKKCPMMKKSDFDISGLKAEKTIQIGGRPGTNRDDSLKDAAKLV